MFQRTDDKYDVEVLISSCRLTLACFCAALHVQSDHTVLTIECASFAYQMHACFGKLANMVGFGFPWLTLRCRFYGRK